MPQVSIVALLAKSVGSIFLENDSVFKLEWLLQRKPDI